MLAQPVVYCAGYTTKRLPGHRRNSFESSQGEVFDVAVDLRVGSPTFGQWAGGALSGEDGVILYIPEGFAHGYVCLSEQADLVYKVSNEFDASLDGGIVWDDPVIGIPWPLEESYSV